MRVKEGTKRHAPASALLTTSTAVQQHTQAAQGRNSSRPKSGLGVHLCDEVMCGVT
jgi:hypothetical protein